MLAWIEQAASSKRPSELGPEDPALTEEWRTLPRHANLLPAEGRGYAAIHWHAPRLQPDASTHDARQLRVHVHVLADLYDFIRRHLARPTLALFARPIVKVDVSGWLRVGFVKPDAQLASD
ncbi:MAG TPA: hypothetical protein VK427_12515, partial [Kofleriaceae bacterium]|nr:hypothetical protein [Kofleriaceae bacterium]